jgi:hypothetical protein
MTEADRGAPIAYTVLAEGTPVETRDGQRIGTVKRVLGDQGTDIFDGIVVDTSEGERFVDGDVAGELYERVVVTTLSAEDAARLPEPEPGPAALSLDPDDIAGDTTGDKAKGLARRAWDRISGNY